MDEKAVLPSNFSVLKAHRTQALLSKKVIEEDRLPDRIESIAGVDVAYTGKIAIGAVSVLDYNSLGTIESQIAVCEVKMPYVPTLLAFREVPAATACIRRLTKKPDVFLVDGHGIAHPHNFGLASHLGLIVGRPTIGVAKTKLVGETIQNGEEAFLNYRGRTVGAAIRTVERGKPIYVSVGNLVSLETAIEIVKKCTRSGGYPEPLRQAHVTASELKRQLERTSDLQKI